LISIFTFNSSYKEKEIDNIKKEREECDAKVKKAEEELRSLNDKVQNRTLEIQSYRLVAFVVILLI
jgi:chromosome segregation ATPase